MLEMSAALPPGPAQRSNQSCAFLLTAAKISETNCEPSSCTPARRSRIAGIAPGEPESRTPYGEN